jgi:sensor c-di-GMP phosphodiesterase-like protein
MKEYVSFWLAQSLIEICLSILFGAVMALLLIISYKKSKKDKEELSIKIDKLYRSSKAKGM